MINQPNDTSYPQTDHQSNAELIPTRPLAHRQSPGLSHRRSQMARQSAGLLHRDVPTDRLSAGPTSGSSSSDLLPPVVASSSTGPPILFLTGFFAGVTIRAELQELQKADVGRKYGRKDRRLLDPPPVVKLRLFQVPHPGTAEGECEIDADDIRNIGLVCFADLYSVPEDHDANEDQAARYIASPLATNAPFSSFEDDITMELPLAESFFPDFNPSPFPSTSQLAAPVPGPSIGSSPEIDPSLHLLQSFPGSSWSIPAPAPLPYPINFPSSPEPVDVSSPVSSVDPGYTGDHPQVSERSRCTESLVGSRSVPMNCAEMDGKDTMLFVFSDLAVKTEGRFLLRYRVFDIFSSASSSGHSHPALAECLGGPFRIYSTKKFPGLRASTDLTKHLSYLGTKVTSRQHDTGTKRRRAETDETAHSHETGPVAAAPPSSAGHTTTSISMSSTFIMTEDYIPQYGEDNQM